LSLVLTKICVVRPLGTANANATVPRVFDCTNGSSGMVWLRHAFAIAGSPLMPNCTQRLGLTLKKRLPS
jgi:hypothetical protein